MNLRKQLCLLQVAAPVLAGTALPAMAQNANPAVTNAPTQLPPVVVTGGKITTASRIEEEPLKVPFNASVVTKEELQRSGAATLEEAMRSISGLQHGTQGNFFTRFETRGLRDTQDVLVLVDGVPLRLLQGNADVILIPTLLLERVLLQSLPLRIRAEQVYIRNLKRRKRRILNGHFLSSYAI